MEQRQKFDAHPETGQLRIVGAKRQTRARTLPPRLALAMPMVVRAFTVGTNIGNRKFDECAERSRMRSSYARGCARRAAVLERGVRQATQRCSSLLSRENAHYEIRFITIKTDDLVGSRPNRFPGRRISPASDASSRNSVRKAAIVRSAARLGLSAKPSNGRYMTGPHKKVYKTIILYVLR